jgi:hypothetical protein
VKEAAMPTPKIPPRDAWTQAKELPARAILTEKSPYGVDGGQTIGRDPRQIGAHEFHEAGIAAAPILEVIRAKCLDCCAEQPEEVRKCVAIACPNWPYRMGTNPFRAAISDEEREKRAERARKNFQGRGSTDVPPEYDKDKDLAGSLDVGYAAIRARKAAGGPGWEPK